MFVNKVGDLSLLSEITVLWLNYGSWEYLTLFSCSSITHVNYSLKWEMLLFIGGSNWKVSAIRFTTWLADATEGPTPVSPLIHAATMVTAGVLSIIWLSPLFEKVSFVLVLIVFIGSTTAFFSSTIGLTQNDFKKVIAYSTCSQ